MATTRPETILGDTAVAVHPDDERYKHLIGKTAYVPMLNRAIPVIGDDVCGSRIWHGCAQDHARRTTSTITRSAQRHNLPMINIMNRDASLNENGGAYAGLDRFEARETNLGGYDRRRVDGQDGDVHAHCAAHAARRRDCRAADQRAVVRENGAAGGKGLAAVRDGRIKIVPERFEKVYFNWLENIRDWCISRQLWWGHRIPAFYCENGHITVDRQGPTKCATCGSRNLTQDPDVLDTWFSSGLWPFSTLGWPNKTPDYERFYPTRCAGDGLRHPVFLGGADDHDGLVVHR